MHALPFSVLHGYLLLIVFVGLPLSIFVDDGHGPAQSEKVALDKSMAILVMLHVVLYMYPLDSGNKRKQNTTSIHPSIHAYNNDILAFFASAITSLVRISPSFFSTFNLPILINRKIISSSPK